MKLLSYSDFVSHLACYSVGPGGIPCQLMVGFFAYAKSLEINVDKEELEGTLSSPNQISIDHCSYQSSVLIFFLFSAICVWCDICILLLKSVLIYVKYFYFLDAEWQSRDDVKKALVAAEYKKAQRTAASKVEQMCKGVEKGQNLSGDFNVESGELAPMFFPGPFAIAHHLISSWAFNDAEDGSQALLKQLSSSFSNL